MKLVEDRYRYRLLQPQQAATLKTVGYESTVADKKKDGSTLMQPRTELV